jgi:Tol biopolymer transport system component
MLQSGTRLGPYEIRSLLGAGGMGEVYLALDTRLGRSVALKILPSADASLKARFAREAKAISALSHPNICALYDVGQHDDIDYLVMEYLEGQTLDERLRRGPLKYDELLARGIEIADALDKSHRAGFIHRDLKPSNIMLTKSGAKLLDFGVAKLRVDPSPAASPVPATQTAAIGVTRSGSVVGTLQYMAPEALEGKAVDARSDLFALGAVLFEMGTGRRAFSATSHDTLVVDILSVDPPLEELQASTSAGFAHLVKTCLTKNPDDRRQNAHDVKLQLEWLAAAPQVKLLESHADRGWRRWAWGIGAVAVVALAAWTAGFLATSPPRPQAMRVSILAPGPMTGNASPELSPDGRKIAITGLGPTGERALWIRSLESSSAVLIAGTEGAYDPFWSPDNQFVGFFASEKLKTVAVDVGGAAPLVQTIADAPDARGGTWNREGDIVFSRRLDDGLYLVRPSRGDVTAVTTLDRTRHNSHRWPQFLPDGRHLIYLARSAVAEQQGIYIGTVGSSDWKLLLRTPLSALVATLSDATSGRDGPHLLFIRDRTLMAQRIDLDRLELTGEPWPIAESIGTAQNRGLFSVAGSSALVYRSTSDTDDTIRPIWFDRSGKTQGAAGLPTGSAPRVSRDDKQIAVTRIDPDTGAGDIWLHDQVRGTIRLTSEPSYEWIPVWSPDGTRVAFGSNRTGSMDLYEKSVSGLEPDRLLLASDKLKAPTDWSRDGKFLVYQQTDPANGWDIWALPMGGTKQAFPLLQSQFNETLGVLSPDGRLLAYVSDETGTAQVYVREFAGDPSAAANPVPQGVKRSVSPSGGSQPRWRSDGKELFYLSADRKVVVVPVTPGPPFGTGAPVPLFAVPIQNPNSSAPVFDVSSDGRRFLVMAPSSEPRQTLVTLILNWTQTLKR